MSSFLNAALNTIQMLESEVINVKLADFQRSCADLRLDWCLLPFRRYKWNRGLLLFCQRVVCVTHNPDGKHKAEQKQLKMKNCGEAVAFSCCSLNT